MSEKSTTLHTIARLVLRELRQEKNIQQAQIAQMLGKTSSSWSKVESGDTPLTLEHLFTACTALFVWPSEVLHTAQNYMHLFQQNNWFVASYGSPLPKESDDLSLAADDFYGLAAKQAVLQSVRLYPVLQTPWPYANCYKPLDVFAWALMEPELRNQLVYQKPIVRRVVT